MSRRDDRSTSEVSSAGRPPADDRGQPEEVSVIRREEELQVGTDVRPAGSVRVRKHVESHPFEEVVPRSVEHADVERVVPHEADSGEVETLPDGSVSIPVFEEEIVVTRRTVVRERVIIRKHTVTERHRVEAELRRERVEVAADAALEDRIDAGSVADAGPAPSRGSHRERRTR